MSRRSRRDLQCFTGNWSFGAVRFVQVCSGLFSLVQVDPGRLAGRRAWGEIPAASAGMTENIGRAWQRELEKFFLRGELGGSAVFYGGSCDLGGWFWSILGWFCRFGAGFWAGLAWLGAPFPDRWPFRTRVLFWLVGVKGAGSGAGAHKGRPYRREGIGETEGGAAHRALGTATHFTPSAYGISPSKGERSLRRRRRLLASR